MSYKDPFLLENLKDKIIELRNRNDIASPELVKEIEDYIDQISINLSAPGASWLDFSAFWPPRCINAMKNKDVIIFFGAGLSLSCGIPSWDQLLTIHLGLDKSLINDTDLANDPLTLAELASHYNGSEVLQSILREVINKTRYFSINHIILAALRCPFYITTNYDCLFEDAWKSINIGNKLIVVTNDADIHTSDYNDAKKNGRSILYKIHGSVERVDEYLVLTRRDYRIHYRTNNNFFGCIKDLLKEKHTIFLGFSHRDPEVSRLVEDVIYDYEKNKPRDQFIEPRPQFYSLQFGMNLHTPEIFAARGIVALSPPNVNTLTDKIRDKALAVALVDILAAIKFDFHSKVSLDNELKIAINKLAAELSSGINEMRSFENKAFLSLESDNPDFSWMGELLKAMGELASQGIYLLNEQGKIIGLNIPKGLDLKNRNPDISFSKRPYYQQAKSFREAFLSDTAESIFNKNATFFVCLPILKERQQIGLLFSASQVGQWKTPIEIGKKLWKERMSFFLIDSNGICLLPPRDEFQVKKSINSIKGERKKNNIGYNYEQLVEFSRRDLLLIHLSKSVIPVTQDDDVIELYRDLKEFSVVSEIPQTRWKIAVSIPVFLKKKSV